MGVMLNDVEYIVVDNSTSHGETYHVKLYDEDEPRALCFRPLSQAGKEDQYCSMVAGQGTEHVYCGRCSYHNGNVGRPSTNGRYSKYAKNEWKQAYDKFEADDNYQDLRPELTLARTILAELITDHQKYDKKLIQQMLNTIQLIAGILDTINKMDDRHILTVSTIKFIMARAIDIARKYMPEQAFYHFYEEWKAEVLLRPTGGVINPNQVWQVVDGRWNNVE